MDILHQSSPGHYMFHCPGCKHAHVFDQRWSFNGDFQKPTFTPSLLCTTPEVKCHLFITDGIIKYLTDCTHELAGKDVPMVEV